MRLPTGWKVWQSYHSHWESTPNLQFYTNFNHFRLTDLICVKHTKLCQFIWNNTELTQAILLYVISVKWGRAEGHKSKARQTNGKPKTPSYPQLLVVTHVNTKQQYILDWHWTGGENVDYNGMFMLLCFCWISRQLFANSHQLSLDKLIHYQSSLL